MMNSPVFMMLTKTTAAVLLATVFATGTAYAAGGAGKVEDIAFSFEGPFGRFDQQQLQRGLQVYQEVCSACHGLQFVPFRTLGDADGVGLSPIEVKAFAEQYDIWDPVLDDFRIARPTDNFPANDSAGAPDLSLITKARGGFQGPIGTGLTRLFRGGGGPEYVYSLLTHYTGEEKDEALAILYGNETFPGGWISMAPPLEDGYVEYADDSDNSLEAMAADVTAFLTWSAEPKMMARKQMGFVGVLLLAVLSVLLYYTNKTIWAPIKKRSNA